MGVEFHSVHSIILGILIQTINLTTYYQLITMKIYADTSVFGGVFDPEFAAPSQRFFEEIEAGHFTLVTSVIVETEIEPAPKPIKDWFCKFINYAQIAPVGEQAVQL